MKNITAALKEFCAYCLWPIVLFVEINNFPPRFQTEARWCVFWVVVLTLLFAALTWYVDPLWLKIPIAVATVVIYFIAGLFLAVGLLAAVTPEEDYY